MFFPDKAFIREPYFFCQGGVSIVKDDKIYRKGLIVHYGLRIRKILGKSELGREEIKGVVTYLYNTASVHEHKKPVYPIKDPLFIDSLLKIVP